MGDFTLDTPLPTRGCASALRDQLVAYLIRTAPPVGARFHSDHELTRLTKLSRPTVRRALGELHRDGWIERRHGSGTFVGPRVALESLKNLGSSKVASGRRVVRLAVLIHLLGDLAHDWYSAGVIRGIDSAAETHAIAIELLGDREADVKASSRRLIQTRPDVLVFTAPPPRHSLLIGEARHLGIPCTGTGTYLPTLGVPSVCEDGEAAAANAVRYLADRGHRKIGMVLMPYPTPWIFARRAGFMRGLQECGLDVDERMNLWLPGPDQAGNDAALRGFIEQQKTTALLFATYGSMIHLAPLTRSGTLRIPHDLSVITFDQFPSAAPWLGGAEPTVIALPLEQMGIRLAGMARKLAEGREVATEYLQCELVEGGSVAEPRH